MNYQPENGTDRHTNGPPHTKTDSEQSQLRTIPNRLTATARGTVTVSGGGAIAIMVKNRLTSQNREVAATTIWHLKNAIIQAKKKANGCNEQIDMIFLLSGAAST